MTHHPVKVLPDGTHVYADRHRYKPMADEDRVNKVRKPADPRALLFAGDWYLPLELVDEADRVMPDTRPDDQTLLHRADCKCDVCRRPGATRQWRLRARREHRRY